MRAIARFAAIAMSTALIHGSGLSGASAGQLDTPVLHAQVSVTGDYVTLGDLFDNAGAAASIRVFRAPDPGQTGTVSALRVEQAARAHGLLWAPAANAPREVSVSRASTEVSLSAITAVIERALRERLGLGEDGNLTVTLDSDALPLHLPVRLDGSIRASRVEYYSNGTFIAEIDAGMPSLATYRGQAVENITLPVLTRDIGRGETITQGDVELRSFARSRVVARDIVTAAADIVGQAARRSLRAGSSLRMGDLEEPKMVRRGELVTIEYEAPGLLLSVRGKALGDGAMGEEVAILNVQSSRVVQASVKGMGRVAVIPAGATPLTRTASAMPVIR